MQEFEKRLITQLAMNYKDPHEFIGAIGSSFSTTSESEKGSSFEWIGIVLYQRSFFNHALNSWLYALSIAEEIGDTARESGCNDYIASAYVQLGEFNKAIKYSRKSLKIAEEIGDRAIASRCYNNYSIAYGNLGEFNKAIKYSRKSVKIAEEIGDRSGISNSYIGLGNAYARLDNFNKAIENYEKSLKIAEEIDDKTVKSMSYGNLATAYDNMSNFNKAIENFEMSLKIAKEIGYRVGISNSYIGLGGVYSRLGNFNKAIEYYEMSLKIAKEIGSRTGESLCYSNLGIAYTNLGDFNKSIEYIKKRLMIAKEIGDRVGESRCYVGIGVNYAILGDSNKSIEYVKKSLKIAKEIGDRVVESMCYSNLAAAYRNLSDFNKAIEFSEKGLTIDKQIGNLEGESIANFGLSLIYYSTQPEIAYKYLRRSIELGDLTGSKLVQEEHMLAFYGHKSNIYQYMIPLCIQLNKNIEAFEYTERSKSKVFLNILAASKIRPPVNNGGDELELLLKEEDNHLLKLRELQIQHLKNTNITVEPAESDRILKELNEIYDKIENIDPEYVSLRRARPLSLYKIQNILLEKGNNHQYAILVEYFVTKDKVFIFVISPHGFHIKTVQLSQEKLNRYIESYWREVVNYRDYPDIGNTWLELSDYLIKPISEYLSNAEVIYFVPYGLLHYIPIHGLELNGEPLIKNHAVVYSSSASLLQFYKNKGSDLLKSCASFGVVFKEEAKEIAKLFNIRPKLDATKNVVLKNLNNDILHFSCHGYFNKTDPLSSGILLYEKDDINMERNILSAREIFNLKLNSELVTLSACQTGINDTKPGDELIGLTRSLVYAGTASVIVSLWSVDANSTKELMIQFYKYLKDGRDKATALQQAQIKIMQKEEYSHPYFWSPFILVGDRE